MTFTKPQDDTSGVSSAHESLMGAPWHAAKLSDVSYHPRCAMGTCMSVLMSATPGKPLVAFGISIPQSRIVSRSLILRRCTPLRHIQYQVGVDSAALDWLHLPTDASPSTARRQRWSDCVHLCGRYTSRRCRCAGRPGRGPVRHAQDSPIPRAAAGRRRVAESSRPRVARGRRDLSQCHLVLVRSNIGGAQRTAMQYSPASVLAQVECQRSTCSANEASRSARPFCD